MKTVTVKVPDDLFRKLDQSARTRKLSKSEIIREALSVREEAAASLYSRIEDLVFDGSRLPADLSTNPRHLKGYGGDRSRR